MKDLHKAIDLISAERILKVVSFLKWEELSTLMNGRVRQFVSPDDEYTALIPLSNEFSDYYKVITDTLQSIASYENRSLESLINRILNPSYDILKWRIADNYTKEGKIPFFKMTEAIDNIKDILAISCLDTLSPTKFHAKVYTNDVNDNISNYSFGQTEIGSYILNILCPLGNYHYEIFEPTEENIPLNRKINIKLISSIYNIQEDLNADNKNKFDEEVDQGIYSINFLDSLMSIYEDTKDTEMNIIVDWCKDVKFIDNFSLTKVKLEPKYIEQVCDVVEKYRPAKQENTQKIFYGKISSIGSNPNVNEREHVEVQVAVIGDDNKTMNIKAKLNYQQYFSIVNSAFEEGSNIRITGIFSSTGRAKKMENASIEKLD